MTVEMDRVQEFKEWITTFVEDTGDGPIAIARLKELKEVRKALDDGIADLSAIVAEDLGVGVTETPLGVVTVRKGAERYQYPGAKTDEFKSLFNDAVTKALDLIDRDDKELPEIQMANLLWNMWNMGPGNARSSVLKKLTGLRIAEYREAVGKKTSVQVH